MSSQDMHLGVLFVGRVDASLRNAVSGLKGTLGQASGSITQYNQSLKRTPGLTRRAATSNAVLNKQISRVYGGLERIKAALKVTAAYTIAGTAIVGIANLFGNAAAEIVNYDQALRNLEAISGATADQLRVMGNTIKEVAADSKFSTSEVGEGMVLLAQSGLSANESISAIRAVTNLATGTLSDYKTVTDLVTTALRAFNINALDTARITDVMANSINKSKLTVDKLRTAFNFVGAAASQAKLSLEQTAATMQVLANNGLRASTIGTGFRQVLARLISPNDKLREAYEEHGISLEEINPLTVGYTKAIENLAVVLWDGEKSTIDMSKAFQLFKLRGAQAAAVIAKSFVSGDFQRALKNTYEIGAAERMASIQSKGLAVKLAMLAQRVGVLAIAVGETGLTGVFHDLISTMLTAINTTIDFASTISGSVLIQMGLWSLGIFTLTKALKGLALWLGVGTFLKILKETGLVFVTLVRSTTILTAALRTLKWAFAGLVNPLTLAAVGVGTLVAAYQGFLGHADKYSKKQKTISTQSQDTANKTKFYAESLKSLIEEMAAGKDVQSQAISIVRRARKEYPELTKAVEGTAGSFKDYQVALENMSSESAVESIRVLTSLLKEQTATLKEAREYRPEKQLFDFNIGQIPDVVTALEEQDKTSKLLISTLSELIIATDLTEEKALNLVAGIAGTDDASRQLSNTIRDSLIKNINASKEAMHDFNEILERRYKKVVESMPERFKKLYDSLKGIRKIDLIQALSKINKEEAAFRKSTEAIKLSAKEKEEAIAEFSRDRLKKALLSISKEQAQVDKNFKYKVQQAKNEADEEIAQLRRVAAYDKEKEKSFGIDTAELELKSTKDILAIHDNRIKEIRKKYGQEIEIYQGVLQERLNASLAVIEAETRLIEERSKFEEDSLSRSHERYEIGLEKKLNLVNTFYDKEISLTRTRGQQALKEADAISEEVAQLEMSRAKRILEIKQGSIERFEELYKSDKDKYLKVYQQALNDLKKAEIDYNVSVEEYLTSRLTRQTTELQRYRDVTGHILADIDYARREKQREAEELYIRDRATAEETEYAKVEAARNAALQQLEAYRLRAKGENQSLLTKKEKEKVIRTEIKLEQKLADAELELLEVQKRLNESVRTGSSLWQGFTLGITSTKKELLTLGKFGALAGKKIKDSLLEASDQALESFILRTGSAKEAFADFAKNTLVWMAQMIARQMLLNSLNTFFGGGGLFSGIGSFFGLSHGGKEPGKSTNVSRFTSKLRPDERMTIIRKSEAVLTPRQMGDVAASPTMNVEVNVINKTGTEAEVTKSAPRMDAGRWVLDIILDAAVRNKGGFKNNLKGALT